MIIGGASAYTPDIIDGLLRHQAVFAGWELCLHDVHEPNLASVTRLARAMVGARQADLNVTMTTDREAAITGARFILTQPRVGGLKARALDERIPLKYGVIGQETLGPGGFAFAWRTIPLMLAIMADVQRLAPFAWVINYANPAGMVTEAVIRRFPKARFFSLCDMPTGVQWAIGKLMRADYRRIALDYAGINHGGWCSRVWLDGQDILPRLRRWAGVLGLAAPVLPLSEATGALQLLRRYGLVPDPYLRYYYYTGRILPKLRRQAQTRAEVLMERLPLLYGHYEAAGAVQQPVLKMHRGHQSHSDLSSMVIATMAAGGRERFVIQQRNGPSVAGLPADEAAQFPAWVSGDGWERLPLEPLPDTVAPLIRQIKESESMNVTAALTGDAGMAVAAAAANPLVPGRGVAERVITELIKAHKVYLPQFD